MKLYYLFCIRSIKDLQLIKRHLRNVVSETFHPDFEVENGFLDPQIASAGESNEYLRTYVCMSIYLLCMYIHTYV